MLKDNLSLLRNIKGFSQEQVAQSVGVSRQAYAKWESGATIPDIEKAAKLAQLYGVTIDGLMKTYEAEGVGALPPATPGKGIWGTAVINDRGQLVIPKAARDKFGLKAGDRLIVGSDEVGIALSPVDRFQAMLGEILEFAVGKDSEGERG